MRQSGGIYRNSWPYLVTMGNILLFSQLPANVTAKQLNVDSPSPRLPQQNYPADNPAPEETEPNSADLIPPSVVTIEPTDITHSSVQIEGQLSDVGTSDLVQVFF